MMPEPSKVFYDAFNARLTALERDNADIQRALDALDKDWRAKIAPAPTGAAGSMTPDEEPAIIGYVTPVDSEVNIRREPKIADNIVRKLRVGLSAAVTAQTMVVTDLMGGKGYLWHELDEGGYVRNDVVTFTPDKPAPITPINAALWPSPVTGYTITNRHGEHGHRGIDYAAPMGTPVLCGPNGGHVVRVFECADCNPNGDGGRSYNDPKYGMGYGTHIVVRVENAHLPPAVKSVIPKDAFLFCLYAHLSAVSVRPSVMPLDAYQEIGRVGSTGNSSGPHLHFECCFSEYANASWGAIIGNQVNPSLLVKA